VFRAPGLGYLRLWMARRRPQTVHWRRRALLLVELGKHNTGCDPVARSATRLRCRSEMLFVNRSKLVVLTIGEMGKVGRVSAGKITRTAGGRVLKSRVVRSSAPFNLQPTEHGRLLAANGKHWLVGGKDVQSRGSRLLGTPR
jgi:hypothetical protein